MSDNSKKRSKADNGDAPKKPAPSKRPRTTKDPQAKATKSAASAKKPAASKKPVVPAEAAEKAVESPNPAQPAGSAKSAEAPAPRRTVAHAEPAAHDHVRPVRPKATATSGLTGSKLLVIAGLMVAAFLGAYNFAASQGTASAAGVNGGNGLLSALPAGGGCGMSGGSAGSGGGGCCGGGGGAPVEGATTVQGEVQTIDVDTSQGSFSPNVIKAKAGVPIEISFSQAPGGCLSGVYFPDFNINEDLTAGPKTVKLPALDKGEYSFYCQMQMVSAQIVVE